MTPAAQPPEERRLHRLDGGTRLLVHRLIEALTMADEIEAHLLTCGDCAAEGLFDQAAPGEVPRLCPEGRPLFLMARTARRLALAHAERRT